MTTSSDLAFARNFFLVEGLWINRKNPHFQIPRPNGFFLGPLEKSNFCGKF